jgi:hypothetical protein
MLAAGLAAACTPSTPPGFSGSALGDQWSLPLIGPLENGVLFTPVTINTRGPYLFALDPDAAISAIDADVVRDAKLRTEGGPSLIDETGVAQPRVYAEMTNLELGTLIIESRNAAVVRRGSFDMLGRRVFGLLGRDVLADGVVFGFDRDAGVAYIVTAKSFKPAADAAVIAYEPLPSKHKGEYAPPARRLVRAKLGDVERVMHLDLGAAASQLRDVLWDDAKLVAHDVDVAIADEVGSVRRITKASDPVPVTVGPLTGEAAFIPYDDKRWGDHELAGTLGLGFFAGQTLWSSWAAGTLYATPRKPATPAVRIARWDSAVLGKCPNPGCVQARLVDPLQGKPPEDGKPHPGVVMSITRDERAGGMDLEVYVEVEGQPKLPYLIVNLPAHVDRLIHQLRPEYLGVNLVVVDASPFPRRCPNRNGCVDQLAR